MNDSSGDRSLAQPATYFNFVQIGQNAFEFIFEFGQLNPHSGDPSVHSRLVAAPARAVELLNLLKESIDRYERAFGAIRAE